MRKYSIDGATANIVSATRPNKKGRVADPAFHMEEERLSTLPWLELLLAAGLRERPGD